MDQSLKILYIILLVHEFCLSIGKISKLTNGKEISE